MIDEEIKPYLHHFQFLRISQISRRWFVIQNVVLKINVSPEY